jgi:ABC-2 type transport system ATP-binding protein
LRRYCGRGLYLESGELRADGPIDEVIERYERDQGTWVERDLGADDNIEDLSELAATSTDDVDF